MEESSILEKWIESTQDLVDIIDKCFGIENRILPEFHPLKLTYFYGVAEAIKKNIKLGILYKRNNDNGLISCIIEPYCLKQIHQHWYILGHFHRDVEDGPSIDYYRLIPLDKIEEISVTDEVFQLNSEFDATAFFNEYYGTVIDNEAILQKVIIRVLYNGNIFIHHSQKIINKGKSYTDIELTIKPTYDLILYLVGLGDSIKVLSPKWLAEKVSQEHYNALSLYEED